MDPALSYLQFGAGLVLLTALTLIVNHLARIGIGWSPLIAVSRAVAQLSVVAVILQGVLATGWTVALFVALMASTASVTAAGRLEGLWHGKRTAVTGVLSGAFAALLAIFALGLVSFEVRYIVAVSGIVIGNSMTAATLAGRNFMRAASASKPEIEGWLALGATPQRAHEETGRVAVRESLLPTLDQTKSTGLVTLPGAFVGALVGGASPVEAAQFQLVVLAGVALAMSITGIVVTRLAGRSPFVSP